jgi:hypothetical protein
MLGIMQKMCLFSLIPSIVWAISRAVSSVIISLKGWADDRHVGRVDGTAENILQQRNQ